MNVGEFFASLTSRFFTEVVAEASARGLAAHANRRKPGDRLPTSVHCGPVLLALNTIGCAIICLAFGVLLFLSIRLGEPVYSVWLLVFLGGLAGSALVAFWDGFVRRVDWNEASVRFRKWNGECTVSWDDIVGMEKKSYPPHVRIAFRDGKGFAIAETMYGSCYFLNLVENRLAPEAPDGATGNKRWRRRQRGRRRWERPGCSVLAYAGGFSINT